MPFFSMRVRKAFTACLLALLAGCAHQVLEPDINLATIDNANVNCFITSVSITKPKDAPWTATLNWQEKIN
mgnify:CR=1 FL=1